MFQAISQPVNLYIDAGFLIPSFVYEKTNSKENVKIIPFLLTSLFLFCNKNGICDGGAKWKLLHLISDPWSLMMRP